MSCQIWEPKNNVVIQAVLKFFMFCIVRTQKRISMQVFRIIPHLSVIDRSSSDQEEHKHLMVFSLLLMVAGVTIRCNVSISLL